METYKLELSLDELNFILQAVASQPYIKAAPVITKIQEQATKQNLGTEIVDDGKPE